MRVGSLDCNCAISPDYYVYRYAIGKSVVNSGSSLR